VNDSIEDSSCVKAVAISETAVPIGRIKHRWPLSCAAACGIYSQREGMSVPALQVTTAEEKQMPRE